MPFTVHTTKLKSAPTPASRAVTCVTHDGMQINTWAEVQPAGVDLFRVWIEQVERLPHHKRGVSRSLSFVISRAGLRHICSVGEGA